MGKTKIKTVDESQPVEEAKSKKKLGRTDELVEKLKAELGVTEEKTIEDRGIHPQPSTLKKPSSTINYPSSKKVRSKKYQEASKDLDKSKSYSLNEALELIKKVSYTKYIGTLEAHINTHQKGLRGLVSLPFASGKKLKILAFATNTPGVGLLVPSGLVPSIVEGVEGDSPGVDNVTFGDDSTIEQISKGKVDFDLVVTTPEWMSKLAKIARILGPRGLMPNPKNGTIANPSADGLKKAVESFQSGKTEFKTEAKAQVIHLGLGKLNQPKEELNANVKTLLQTIGKTRVKKLTLSPTMGPAVKVDLSSI